MKRLIIFLAIVGLLAGCATSAVNSTYSRGPDGTITATNGSFGLLYGPDGKTIVGESFTPTPGTGGGGIGMSQLIQFITAFMGQNMQMQAKAQGGK